MHPSTLNKSSLSTFHMMMVYVRRNREACNANEIEASGMVCAVANRRSQCCTSLVLLLLRLKIFPLLTSAKEIVSRPPTWQEPTVGNLRRQLCGQSNQPIFRFIETSTRITFFFTNAHLHYATARPTIKGTKSWIHFKLKNAILTSVIWMCGSVTCPRNQSVVDRRWRSVDTTPILIVGYDVMLLDRFRSRIVRSDDLVVNFFHVFLMMGCRRHVNSLDFDRFRKCYGWFSRTGRHGLNPWSGFVVTVTGASFRVTPAPRKHTVLGC